MKQPFLALPTEILMLILQNLVRPLQQPGVFDPCWRSTLLDNSPLAPVSRTCRCLRQISRGIATGHLFLTSSDLLGLGNSVSPDKLLNVYVDMSDVAPLALKFFCNA